MHYVIIVKATTDSEAGKKPFEALLVERKNMDIGRLERACKQAVEEPLR